MAYFLIFALMKEFDIKDLELDFGNKTVDESRQGEAMERAIPEGITPNGKKYFIESYGCAMNFNDSEIVASILAKEGYASTRDFNEADLVLMNTCSIRENAEVRVRNKLANYAVIKKRNKSALIGILGCMAERLKDKLLEEEKMVDIVVGPDGYRTLPQLIAEAESGQKSVNVLLSREETYADINPVRLVSNGVSAFVSITRGCDNICSFCVVPFTRGRERSRSHLSILTEVKDLYTKGYREVTLLGQNVDSYRFSEDKKLLGKKLIDQKDEEHVVNFANLLEMTAQVAPDLRVRFSTSHPKDMGDDVLYVMANYKNICDYIHLPVQSGNSELLKKMNRSYTREWYMNRIEAIWRILPEASISSDMIAGFCSETEEQHEETLSLMRKVNYSFSYMYYYSERPGTLAAKKYDDDIPLETKKRRLQEIINLQNELSYANNQKDVGKTVEVLIEGFSKRSKEHLQGRNSQNKTVIFPKENSKIGDYVNIKVTGFTQAVLLGEIVD